MTPGQSQGKPKGRASNMQSIATLRAPLAMAGRCWLAVEYKRKMTGYAWWKQIVFHIFLAFARFCDTVLELPTIIRYDRRDRFWIDYCGSFSSKDLTLSAIDVMRAEREREGRKSQFGWTELPLNGVTPEQSGRYLDQDFPGTDTLQFQRANQIVKCPFNGSQCNPDETIKRQAIDEIVRESTRVVEGARKLKRSII